MKIPFEVKLIGGAFLLSSVAISGILLVALNPLLWMLPAVFLACPNPNPFSFDCGGNVKYTWIRVWELVALVVAVCTYHLYLGRAKRAADTGQSDSATREGDSK
jgi:hypothetical protein